MAAPFGERRNSVEATGSDLPSRPANHAFDWTTSHPVQCFPKEHALAEVRHQCHVLRGLLPSEPVAQGVAVAATISGATSSPCAATGAVAVGVALDRPPPAAHYSFLGSGMTADAHAPQHSSVDLEGEGGAGEMARLHFEYYGRCYHHEPRYKYEHEHTFPSGEAIGAARTEFDTLLARAKGQSLACRAYNAVERPVPQKQPNELPRPHLQRTIRLSGSRGDDARIYSCSWAGDRHVVCSIRTGYLLVCDVTNGMRTMVASPKGRGHVCLLGAAAHGAHSHAPPTLLACGGLTNAIHLWNLQASGDAKPPRSGVVEQTSVIEGGHVGYVSSLTFLPAVGGAHLLSTSGDGTCKLWDVQRATTTHGGGGGGTGSPPPPLLCMLGHTADVTNASVATEHAGGKLVCTGSTDGTCRVWDLRTGACVRLFSLPSTHGVLDDRYPGELSQPVAVSISADGTTAVAGQGYGVSSLDVGGYARVYTAACCSHRLTSIALHPDGRSGVFGSARGALRAFSPFESSPRHAHGPSEYCFATTKHEAAASTARPRGGQAAGESGAAPATPSLTVSAVAFAPDGARERLVSASWDGVVRGWSWGREPPPRGKGGFGRPARAT